MISMPSTATTSARDGLPAFFTLAFGLSWGCWIPVALAERGHLELPVPALALTIIGAFGPMGAALIVAGSVHGARGVRGLLGRLRLRGLDRRWLWLALAVGLVDLSPTAVHLIDGGPLPEDIVGQVLIMPVHFVFVALVGGGLDEEMGWRGFALPALQHRLAPLPANLMLGVVWATWHLPLFFTPSWSQSQSSFGVYLVTLVAQSIVIGWLFNASGGSLLVAIVAHAAANTGDGLRLAVTTDAAGAAWLQMTAYIVIAVLVVWRTGGRLGLDHKGRTGQPAQHRLPPQQRRLERRGSLREDRRAGMPVREGPAGRAGCRRTGPSRGTDPVAPRRQPSGL